MLFIDFLAVMLLNMSIGLIMLAGLVYEGFDPDTARKWAPGFAVVGIVGLVTSVPMVVTWPLPGQFNVAYGETALMFATLWLIAAITLAMKSSLFSLTIYSFFSGGISILIGINILYYNLTKSPAISAIGFIITGIVAMLAFPTIIYLKENKKWRTVGALLTIAAAGVWGITSVGAYWGHLSGFSKWTPKSMCSEVAPPQK